MKGSPAAYLTLLIVAGMAYPIHSQKLKLGEVIIISTSALKQSPGPLTLEACMEGISREWRPSENVSVLLFKADRGKKKGNYAVVCEAATVKAREALPAGSPFTDPTLGVNWDITCKLSNYLANPEAYTEYHLLGAGKVNTMAETRLLGMHFIKVKPEMAKDFEKFVVEEVNPAVNDILPDLQLLYYKAVAGDNAGSYLTVFALESTAARDKYWPAGKEMQVLKDAFKPVQPLAAKLGTYLVEGSYLEPSSGGAAAYYESKDWTDFVYYPK